MNNMGPFIWRCSKCGDQTITHDMKFPDTLITVGGNFGGSKAIICKPKQVKEQGKDKQENNDKRWEAELNNIRGEQKRLDKLLMRYTVMSEVFMMMVHDANMNKIDQLTRDIESTNAWADIRVAALEQYKYDQEMVKRRTMADIREKVIVLRNKIEDKQ